jgi:hypothetical protein
MFIDKGFGRWSLEEVIKANWYFGVNYGVKFSKTQLGCFSQHTNMVGGSATSLRLSLHPLSAFYDTCYKAVIHINTIGIVSVILIFTRKRDKVYVTTGRIKRNSQIASSATIYFNFMVDLVNMSARERTDLCIVWKHLTFTTMFISVTLRIYAFRPIVFVPTSGGLMYAVCTELNSFSHNSDISFIHDQGIQRLPHLSTASRILATSSFREHTESLTWFEKAVGSNWYRAHL